MVAFEFVNGVGFIVEISFSDDDVLVHCSLLLDDGGFIGVKLSKSGHNTGPKNAWGNILPKGFSHFRVILIYFAMAINWKIV